MRILKVITTAIFCLVPSSTAKSPGTLGRRKAGRAWDGALSHGKRNTVQNMNPRFQMNMFIQSVSRLCGITAGGDFLGLCDQKSSYKHVSDFGRLRSYDHLKLRIEGNDS